MPGARARLRSTCCRRSCAPPCRGRAPRRPSTRARAPVPPPTPICAMTARIMSLAVTPRARCPSTRTSSVFGLRCKRHCVASTCATSRRADAEGERAERAVRRGVAVAADDRHARLREAELGPDDVHDAALVGVEPVQLDAEVRAVAARACRAACAASPSMTLRPASSASNGPSSPPCARAGARRAPRLRRTGERLRRRHFVHEMQIDVEHRRARLPPG